MKKRISKNMIISELKAMGVDHMTASYIDLKDAVEDVLVEAGSKRSSDYTDLDWEKLWNRAEDWVDRLDK
jgi:hypothetical protein